MAKIQRTTRPDRPASRIANAASPHSVRIIGGQWKRTPLAIVEVEGLRPTPDRVRKTVFDWLTHLFSGSLAGVDVLDAFAGTGALGFEAASRGAARVVLIERNAQAVRALYATREKLGAETLVEIHAIEASSMLKRLAAISRRFDVVFLDPPFGTSLVAEVAPSALAVLKPGGILYIEAEQVLSEEQCASWSAEVLRKDKAGHVFYHLLRRKIDEKPLETPPC